MQENPAYLASEMLLGAKKRDRRYEKEKKEEQKAVQDMEEEK